MFSIKVGSIIEDKDNMKPLIETIWHNQKIPVNHPVPKKSLPNRKEIKVARVAKVKIKDSRKNSPNIVLKTNTVWS